MPIYLYKCSACGHTQDVLQKLSAAPLTDCPACAAAAYSKQVTAPQFQLKGSGWYVTDFKGGSGAAKDIKTDGATEPAKADAKTGDTKSAETKGDAMSDGAKVAAPAASTPAPAPAKPVAANK